VSRRAPHVGRHPCGPSRSPVIAPAPADARLT
jgi:hypothetical protein